MDPRADQLSTDLMDEAGAIPPHPENGRVYGRLSLGIIANPQAHIDALVEAGVLEPIPYFKEFEPLEAPASVGYRVVQPHKHEWRVRAWTAVSPGMKHPTLLDLICDCGEVKHVPNRLPVLVPE